MDEKTVFEYENTIGKLVFAYDSPFWIESIDNVSSVDIEISESQSNDQIGSSVAGQSVQPRSIPVTGCIFAPLDANENKVLRIIAPQVPSTLTVLQKGESWFLDVLPKKTPDFMPGNGVRQFQMRLHAAYPYWRTTASYSMQLAGITALFKFPFYTGGKWWISKFSDTFFATLINPGNVPVEFRVVFTARSALSNPELYHMGTGKRIRIIKDMVAGERIIVSTVPTPNTTPCLMLAVMKNWLNICGISQSLALLFNTTCNSMLIISWETVCRSN